KTRSRSRARSAAFRCSMLIFTGGVSANRSRRRAEVDSWAANDRYAEENEKTIAKRARVRSFIRPVINKEHFLQR
ncbi:MAG: hypothetical protein M3261_00225, partial [Thermoproteota archaeon]|nr:hypothetical protein [Thermoproteota archaeon]